MSWKTVVAIYLLFWVMSAFLVLPFEARAARGTNAETIKGQEPGAPATFKPGRIILRTTLLSAVLFGFFYLNYQQGWITVQMLDVLN